MIYSKELQCNGQYEYEIPWHFDGRYGIGSIHFGAYKPFPQQVTLISITTAHSLSRLGTGYEANILHHTRISPQPRAYAGPICPPLFGASSRKISSRI